MGGLKIKRKTADGTYEYIAVTDVNQISEMTADDVLVFEAEDGTMTELLSAENVDKIISDIDERTGEIDGEIDEAPEEVLDALEEEIDTLKERRKCLMAYKRAIARRALSRKQTRGAFQRASFNAQARGEMNRRNELEKRSRDLVSNGRISFGNVETRAALVSGGKIATPTQVSGINDAFNAVSSIVDLIRIEDCTGMGTYKVAYVKSNPTAASHTEGAAITESDVDLGFTTITPESLACISYISEQVKRQTPLTYTEKIQSCSLAALRAAAAKKATKSIYDATITDKLSVADINETTLRKITFAYGGAENVPGDAVLFLSKDDLVAFGDIRGTNEKLPVYEIIPDTSNPNIGVIRDGGLSVKYCINSNCGAISTATKDKTNTMIYGQPLNCTLGLFGDFEVKVSEDFKFDKQLLAIRGNVDVGCGVTYDKGFVVVQKYVAPTQG